MLTEFSFFGKHVEKKTIFMVFQIDELAFQEIELILLESKRHSANISDFLRVCNHFLSCTLFFFFMDPGVSFWTKTCSICASVENRSQFFHHRSKLFHH